MPSFDIFQAGRLVYRPQRFRSRSRKVNSSDDIPFVQEDRPFDDVFQFPYIARPGEFKKFVDYSCRKGRFRFAHFFAVETNKMTGKVWNVFGPFPKGGQKNWKDCKPVV